MDGPFRWNAMARSSRFRTVIGVGGVVRLGDGNVLVRLTYSRHRGKFMLPGGKVEHGESLEAALVREVREETGIEAEPDGIVAVRHRVDPDELNTFVIFEMRHVRGSPRVVSPEADEVRVFSADDLRRAPEDFRVTGARDCASGTRRVVHPPPAERRLSAPLGV